MTIGRREFLAGAGALAVSARSAFAGLNPCGPGRSFPPRSAPTFRRVGRDLHELRGAPPAGHLRRARRRAGHRLPPARTGRGPRRFRRGEAGGPEEALRPADRRHGHRDRLHRQHLRRREHRRHGAGPAANAAATSSSTSCTSRPRSTCTRSSRRRASSSASSSIATGRSTSTTWTRRSIATRGSCRWRWCRTSTASCTTARR